MRNNQRTMHMARFLNQYGQTSMLELLFGTLLVLVIIIAITNALSNAFTASQSRQVFSDFVQSIDSLSEKLLQSPGSTNTKKTNWENHASLNDVNQIGLITAPYLLSIEKIRRLHYWAYADYAGVKQKLGVGGYEFSFSIIIRDYPSGIEHPVLDPNSNVPYLEIPVSYADILSGSSRRYWTTKVERAMVLDHGSYINEQGQKITIHNKPVVFQLKLYAPNPFEQ